MRRENLAEVLFYNDRFVKEEASEKDTIIINMQTYI